MRVKWLVVLAVLVLPYGLVSAGEDMGAFLKKYYGWSIDRKQIGRSWDLSCPGQNAPLPEEDKNVFRNWVCRQEDKSYWTVIFWRLPSVKPEAVQRMVYNGMSSGLGYGQTTCIKEEVMHEGLPFGFIEDCEVPLQHGKFYVSFHHFSAHIPTSYVAPGKAKKSSNQLEFTIWVQNAGISDPAVKEKLRELVKAIRFASVP